MVLEWCRVERTDRGEKSPVPKAVRWLSDTPYCTHSRSVFCSMRLELARQARWPSVVKRITEVLSRCQENCHIRDRWIKERNDGEDCRTLENQLREVSNQLV